MAYTSFFRDADALKAIEEIVIPALSHQRVIRVWDAGCATGEEPYTVAIIFASKLGAFSFRSLDILATDHEESSYAQFALHIKTGVYGRKDIFWVPKELREAYFTPTDDPENFLLTEAIRDKVRYLRHDLLTLVPPETGQSLIICKNVLMHFSPPQQALVLDMYWNCLLPEGYLVMDCNQEMPGELEDRFQRVERGAPLFQKKGT
ncbi:MAG: CheR family methyltransferase [Spirochaetota bacterium]